MFLRRMQGEDERFPWVGSRSPMSYQQRTGARKKNVNEYATCDDFCEIFTENLNELYQLCLLLTGDQGKAEQCFVITLDDVFNATTNVFRECALSWAKRAVIKSAIRALQPHPGDAADSIPAPPQGHSVMEKLSALNDFERFVFVMSVLERYSERDSALLLDCSLPDIRTARTRALAVLAMQVPKGDT